MNKCEWYKCKIQTSGKYCFMHNKLVGGTPTTAAKPPKPIAKESEKRKAENKVYKKVKNEIFAEGDRCELKIMGVCTGKAEGLDHIQKRSPANLTVKTNLKRACNACNRWKEQNPKAAELMGISKSKFKNL